MQSTRRLDRAERVDQQAHGEGAGSRRGTWVDRRVSHRGVGHPPCAHNSCWRWLQPECRPAHAAGGKPPIRSPPAGCGASDRRAPSRVVSAETNFTANVRDPSGKTNPSPGGFAPTTHRPSIGYRVRVPKASVRPCNHAFAARILPGSQRARRPCSPACGEVSAVGGDGPGFFSTLKEFGRSLLHPRTYSLKNSYLLVGLLLDLACPVLRWAFCCR